MKLFRRRAAPTAAREPDYGADFVAHSIPERMEEGETYGIRVTVRNTGAIAWPIATAHPVNLCIRVDDVVVAVLSLPHDVMPGADATVHFALPSPVAGDHGVRLELVHQHVTWFTARGIAPLDVRVHVDAGPGASPGAVATLLAHNHWHYLPTQGIGRSREGHPYPLLIARAKGCRVWDARGAEFIDYTSGWGSTLLGYADDRVQRAIAATLDTAPIAPFPSPIEMDVTRLLIEDFPGAESVVFGKNGSDVCTLAARLARLATGRTTILSCGFHGWQDFALDPFPFEASGIPPREAVSLHKFTFNDFDDFDRLFAAHRGTLAAVMIEPSGPFGGEAIGPCGDINVEFLRHVAARTREAGALLVFDEIITGFRYPGGSVQRATGVVPDLTCLGKALAAGMPLAALLGRRAIFDAHFHQTHYCPTFKAEIYSFAAAKAAIEIYRTEPVAQHVWRHGRALRRGINHLCNTLGIRASMKGPPFRLGLVFDESDAYARSVKRTLYMQELLKRRVITVTGIMLPSYAHDDSVLQQTLDAVRGALDVMAAAERAGDLHRYIEIPLL